MVKKSNGWNLQEMQETLVKDTEQSIEQGFKEIANDSVPSGSCVPSVASDQWSSGIPACGLNAPLGRPCRDVYKE